MERTMTFLGVSVGFVLLLSGCATKGFVREQTTTAESRLSQKIDQQGQGLARTEAALHETGGQVQVIRQRIEGLDTRVNEVTGLAREARENSDKVASSVQDTESRLNKKFQERNRYRVLETKTIHFDFGKSELKDEAITFLLEVAQVLKEDPNAIIELEGHTDTIGTDEYNLQLSRARVDSVMRHLVQKHGIKLRRLYAVGHGKAVPAADNSTKEGREKNRRVTIKILTV